MTNQLTGLVFLLASGATALLGYLASTKFRTGGQPRIGAIDALFSIRGLLQLLGLGLFHAVWFGATFTLMVLGIGYFL